MFFLWELGVVRGVGGLTVTCKTGKKKYPWKLIHMGLQENSFSDLFNSFWIVGLRVNCCNSNGMIGIIERLFQAASAGSPEHSGKAPLEVLLAAIPITR